MTSAQRERLGRLAGIVGILISLCIIVLGLTGVI